MMRSHDEDHDEVMSNLTSLRPRVLIVAPHYLPAFKAGGPPRSIAGVVTTLVKEIDPWIVCSDRDLGDAKPFDGVPTNKWVDRSEAHVRYLSVENFNIRNFRTFLKEVQPDIVWLNTIFSYRFTLAPIVAARTSPDRPQILLSPRGSLSPEHLVWKRWKKRPYLWLFRRLHLGDMVTWHATSPQESEDILREIPHAVIKQAANIASSTRPDFANRLPKKPGSLNAIFLSRISPQKGLLRAIDLLSMSEGSIHLTIAGHVEDAKYWEDCQEAIQRLPPNISVSMRGAISHEEAIVELEMNHLLISPTAHENFGHSIAEAMARGCLCLISDQTPWRNLAEQLCGWDLPLDDRGSWGAALNEATLLTQSEFDVRSEAAMSAADRMQRRSEAVDASRQLFEPPRAT